MAIPVISASENLGLLPPSPFEGNSIRKGMTSQGVFEREPTIASVLLGELEFIALHLPLDSNEEIEMHAFGLEPAFQDLT